MSTSKLVLAMGCLFAIFGIVGRMDYEDALRMEQANGNNAMRLFCQHESIEPLDYIHSPAAGVATSQPVTFNPNDDASSLPFQELRCIVVNE